jgi:hypothetical protein
MEEQPVIVRSELNPCGSNKFILCIPQAISRLATVTSCYCKYASPGLLLTDLTYVQVCSSVASGIVTLGEWSQVYLQSNNTAANTDLGLDPRGEMIIYLTSQMLRRCFLALIIPIYNMRALLGIAASTSWGSDSLRGLYNY